MAMLSLASTLHSHDSLISLALSILLCLSPFFCVCFFVYVVFVCCSCNVLLLIGDCLASYFEWNHEHIYFQENCIIYFIWRLRIFLWGFTSYSFIIFESETLFNIKFFIFCVLLASKLWVGNWKIVYGVFPTKCTRLIIIKITLSDEIHLIFNLKTLGNKLLNVFLFLITPKMAQFWNVIETINISKLRAARGKKNTTQHKVTDLEGKLYCKQKTSICLKGGLSLPNQN